MNLFALTSKKSKLNMCMVFYPYFFSILLLKAQLRCSLERDLLLIFMKLIVKKRNNRYPSRHASNWSCLHYTVCVELRYLLVWYGQARLRTNLFMVNLVMVHLSMVLPLLDIKCLSSLNYPHSRKLKNLLYSS